MCGGQQKAQVCSHNAMGAVRHPGCAAVAVAAAVAPGPATELCPVLGLELQLGSTAVSSCAIRRHWALCSLQGEAELWAEGVQTVSARVCVCV